MSFSEQERTWLESSSTRDQRLPGPGQVGGEGESEETALEADEMETPLPPSTEDTDMNETETSPIPTPTSSLPSPLLPLPDFMTALNMQLARSRYSAVQGVESEGVASEIESEAETKMSLGPGPKEILIEKFKKDPSSVLSLLQSALSMEKLTTLLSDEHKDNSELLLQLQNKLEAAYYTLEECEKTKKELAETMADTKQKLEEKRKYMEELRGDLKILGSEEMRLKKKRDIAEHKYLEMKKIHDCSTDALEQIEHLRKTMPPSSFMETVLPPDTPPEGEEPEDGSHGDDNNIVENGTPEEEEAQEL